MKWCLVVFYLSTDLQVERVHDIADKASCVAIAEQYNKRYGPGTTRDFAYCVPEDRVVTERVEVAR